MIANEIRRAAELFRQAQSILFITGAGVSADSGLPTYRGVSGLYDQSNTEDGMPIEVALSGRTFRTKPDITWKYMGQIEDAARGKTFNRAHEVIAEIEKRWPRVWTLTQNIDGFHLAAGSQNVIEIHGTMKRLRCLSCPTEKAIWDYTTITIPPPCTCGSTMRPDVVLFGEMLPVLQVATLERELRIGFDLVISVGTSSVFPYIVEPIWQAHREGKGTIEINPAEATELTSFVDLAIKSRAAPAFDELAKLLF